MTVKSPHETDKQTSRMKERPKRKCDEGKGSCSRTRYFQVYRMKGRTFLTTTQNRHQDDDVVLQLLLWVREMRWRWESIRKVDSCNSRLKRLIYTPLSISSLSKVCISKTWMTQDSRNKEDCLQICLGKPSAWFLSWFESRFEFLVQRLSLSLSLWSRWGTRRSLHDSLSIDGLVTYRLLSGKVDLFTEKTWILLHRNSFFLDRESWLTCPGNMFFSLFLLHLLDSLVMSSIDRNMARIPGYSRERAESWRNSLDCILLSVSM